MMTGIHIFENQITNYCSNEKKRYNLWVYDNGEILQVFTEQKPNTINLWFQFYSFSNLYWKIMQSSCIDRINGNSYYNHSNIKLFMIKYLFCGTNISDIKLQRLTNGELTEDSFESLMQIHPRIWRSLFQIVQLFPKQLSKQEEKNLEKQCAILFGQGNSVAQPHEYIVTYCNLVAFWEKFGMNYYDILKLPHETFLFLKKIMSLQSDHRKKSIIENKNSHPMPNKRGVRF